MSAVLTDRETTPQRPDWLADDADRFEPVSSHKFPDNREIYREIRNIRQSDAISTPNHPAQSMPCNQIPYRRKTGNCFDQTGNLIQGSA
jgi:hypothetical protein